MFFHNVRIALQGLGHGAEQHAEAVFEERGQPYQPFIGRGDVVRFRGEQIAAIIAETEEAAMEAASRVILDLEELPESVRPIFSQLASELHRVCPLGEESPVWATVRKMSDEDADRCAETIVELYASVTRLTSTA